MAYGFRSLCVSALAVLSAAALSSPSAATELSLEDFLPPAQGGSTEVAGEVTEEDGLLTAGTAQDGLNAAYQSLVEAGRDGIEEIVVPSGFAVISVATSDYRTYDNRNATLLSKRAAYTRAMVRAQKQMVENMEGLMTACERSVNTSLESRDSGTGENQANVQSTVTERCEEQVSGVLNGYVVYAVRDNAPDEKTVTVALASSTKTREAAQRIGTSVIVAHNRERAWDTLMAEITNGFAPPMGARLLMDPETGQGVVVGYGSAIVRANPDEAVARKLQQAAERQAQMRANSSLVSFLTGDELYWEGSFDETQIEGSEQFAYVEPPAEGDGSATPQDMLGSVLQEALHALTQGDGPVPSVHVFDQTRQTFLNTLSQSEAFDVVTKGHLPPGVKKKAFIDDTGDWAVAISVYASPAVGEGASDSLREPPPPAPITGGVNEEAENPEGPSGQATDRGDL